MTCPVASGKCLEGSPPPCPQDLISFHTLAAATFYFSSLHHELFAHELGGRQNSGKHIGHGPGTGSAGIQQLAPFHGLKPTSRIARVTPRTPSLQPEPLALCTPPQCLFLKLQRKPLATSPPSAPTCRWARATFLRRAPDNLPLKSSPRQALR